MADKCVYGFDGPMGSARYSHAVCICERCCWFSFNNTGLHQDLFSCKTPQESYSGYVSPECDTDWRNGEFCKSI